MYVERARNPPVWKSVGTHPPLEHRNGIITDYIIKYKSKGGQNRYAPVDGTKTSFVLRNLKKFTKYFVWVRANTKVGRGPFTDKYIFSTAEDGTLNEKLSMLVSIT